MMKTQKEIEPFAAMVEQQQRAEFARDYPGPYFDERCDMACKVKLSMGKKFARVDVGQSGKYMVDLETGEIYSIKGYGVVHRGHRFGTLDTIGDWDWSGYRATQRKLVAA
jgi:hypothetical protein